MFESGRRKKFQVLTDDKVFLKKKLFCLLVDFPIKKKSTQSKTKKIIPEPPSLKTVIYAASKVTKFGVFSGPYFSAFIPNT